MEREPALILVVDDDPDFLEWSRHVLETGGYRVACVNEADKAAAAAAETKPSLVVTDLMMGRLDSGFSLAAQLKAVGGSVPVILVTAAGSQRGFDFRPRSVEDLAAMNADAFFTKPVNPGRFLEKIEELLNASDAPEASGPRM